MSSGGAADALSGALTLGGTVALGSALTLGETVALGTALTLGETVALGGATGSAAGTISGASCSLQAAAKMRRCVSASSAHTRATRGLNSGGVIAGGDEAVSEGPGVLDGSATVGFGVGAGSVAVADGATSG